MVSLCDSKNVALNLVIMRKIKEKNKYRILKKILKYWTKEQFDSKLNIKFRILDPPIIFSQTLFQLVNLYVN